jgi:hypothetical protein
MEATPQSTVPNFGPATLGQVAASALKAPASTASRRFKLLFWRGLIFPVKLFWGMAFCQSLVGSILVVGWVNRLTQRRALKYWWARRGDNARNMELAEFLSGNKKEPDHRRWPNWFVDSRFGENLRADVSTSRGRYAWSLVKGAFASLALNFRLGFRATLNTALLMVPAGMLWWFGWYDGWNNSFSKGYEQAAVGPLISLIGIFWFIAAMFYLPIAQARQAVSGQWRSFYHFNVIWKIVRLKWLACAGLALLYAALAVPLMVFKIFPMFALQKNPALANLSAAEIIKYLDSYYFWKALWLFPAFTLLKQIGGRIYASGLLELAQTGAIGLSSLAENEVEALTRLGLTDRKPSAPRHIALRIIAWAGTRLGRTMTAIVLVFTWFIFVAQIYIAEFFSFHGAIAWLNQPLIQLPWFHYLPTRLKPPIDEVFLLLLLLLAILACSGLARSGRAVRRAFSLSKF